MRGIYTEELKSARLEGESAYILRYNDAAAAAEEIRRDLGYPNEAGSWSKASAWCGGESGDDAITFATVGNDALVPMAEQYLSKIESGGIETTRATWSPSLAGAYPIVPEFLAQRPDCMRRRMDEQGERHPVRVYVDSTSSGGIEAEELKKRGAAILAFVMALAQERPVELWQYGCLDGHGYRTNIAALAVRLPTAPLNLSVCAHLLTSQMWVRGIGYGYAKQKHGAAGGWAFGETPDHNRDSRYTRLMRAAFDMEPEDVLVPGIYINDPLISDPVNWINRELARIRATASGEEFQEAA